MKPRAIKVRLTEKQSKKLEKIKEKEGLNTSESVRYLIQKEKV